MSMEKTLLVGLTFWGFCLFRLLLFFFIIFIYSLLLRTLLFSLKVTSGSHNYIKNINQHFMRSAFRLWLSIMVWMKLLTDYRARPWLCKHRIRSRSWAAAVMARAFVYFLWSPEMQSVLCRTSTCPIDNLLSKFCFSIKAEAAVYRHYSKNIKRIWEYNITVLLFFCYSYIPNGSLH